MRGLIVGTGYSLKAQLPLLPRFDGLVFTCNNTFKDVPTDVWLSCDPSWHEHYGKVTGVFAKWHWDKDICSRYGYRYVEGVWVDGLVMDTPQISYNHCSGAQLLNLAANPHFYGCEEIVLVGHDFHYNAPQRHYFDDLSGDKGEYPKAIRKYSKFDKKGQGNDLLQVYRRISDQSRLPPIINCTPDSALPWFPMGKLEDYLRPEDRKNDRKSYSYRQ